MTTAWTTGTGSASSNSEFWQTSVTYADGVWIDYTSVAELWTPKPVACDPKAGLDIWRWLSLFPIGRPRIGHRKHWFLLSPPRVVAQRFDWQY